MTTRVHRVEVRTAPGHDDPRAGALLAQARREGFDLRAVSTARVYLIEAPLAHDQLHAVRDRLLADPVRERASLGAEPPAQGSTLLEVHPLPGVMDPAAQSVRDALLILVGVEAAVSTGWRFDLLGINPARAEPLARRLLANPVVHAIHTGEPYHPAQLPRTHPHPFSLRRIPLLALNDDALARLSRDAHLFLSLEEMRAIQAEFRRLGREPTDLELETLAQTWSEHCVHKTLKSRIRYGSEAGLLDPITWSGRPGHTLHPDGSVEIDNLLKSTVAAATFRLIDEGCDWALSVFKDNAGVVALDDLHALNIKVETHNHPSAIEPYGGAATGIGGCIRDVIATGLGAKPIASTDVFCVAPPDTADIPPGCIDPRRILTDVVAGVRDYGNRMGIPTVNGAVAFDDRYVGNPLVFCGYIGLMDRSLIEGRPRSGDLIVALGGRTGRDGIHGATFSSAELTDTHADEFSHAVQIGNAIEEKRLLDAVLRARDAGPLFTALTDCGAGGFSSAVGEMGKDLGAVVDLDRAPLKYAGLTYTEIWISEAQERLVLAVPPANLPALRAICDEERVELAVLGTFGTPEADLVLRFHDTEVGRLSMHVLHEGLPQPTREARWTTPSPAQPPARLAPSIADSLLSLLSHPTIASKHWIIRQYDHEVQGNTILKPLVGPRGRGPGDASILEPVPGSNRGCAVACGLSTPVGDSRHGGDPYLMALAAVDECVRNLVCVGTDPTRVAILDNFCWPSCARPQNLAALVRACEGCYDAALAFRTPFVSGKDSLNNQFAYDDPTTGGSRTIEIPFTLLITGLGIVQDLSRAITSDAKRPGNLILLVGPEPETLGASLYAERFAATGPLPRVDLDLAPRLARAVAALIARGLVAAAHDASDGGLLVALAEMLIAGDAIGATLDPSVPATAAFAFAETPSRYLLEVAPEHLDAVRSALASLPHRVLATLTPEPVLAWPGADVRLGVEDLARAWLAPLDW